MRILLDKVLENPSLLDTSELIHPATADWGTDKGKDGFRIYEANPDSELQKRVLKTYHDMHTNQTVDYVKKMQEKWLKFDHFEATIMEALDLLNNVVDESDPDLDLPNIIHAFQTAEKIREKHPDKPWFHLTGLIHDLGKVMAFYGEPQWGVVGDTFPVGCAPQKSVVYYETSFKDNPDLKDSQFNTKLGMYKENCGLENIMMSWGHDEYLYRVLVNHGATLPEEALYMIRFHSFYPWHDGGDYTHLTNDKDEKMKPWVSEFNKFDLYTKSVTQPDVESLKPYYQGLIDKYIPGNIKF